MAKPDAEKGEGEARERARLRRRHAIMAALLIPGFMIGVYVGKTDQGAFINGSGGVLWPALSIALAILYLAALVGGAFLLSSSIDEHEKYNSYKAVSAAGGFYVVAYPVWFLLWKGGFVVEPVHWILFIGFWLSLAVSSLYYRFN
jgi:hypothetical protein